MQHCDVAIVGAGPAGCAAATILARAGRRVVVVDKAAFPRDKFCGDGLTAGALRLLEQLGLDPAAVASWRAVHEVMVRSPSGRCIAYPLPEGQGLFAAVARRVDLDAALVDLARTAGAEILEATTLTGARQTTDEVVLELMAGVAAPPGQTGARPETDRGGADRREISCDYVIGADGMWSPLRKALGVDVAGYLGEWHAFRQYWRGVAPAAAKQLWILFEPDLLPGYFWSFPVGDGDANVGFGIRRGGSVATRDMKALWPELLGRDHVRELLGPDAAPEGPHRAWPIPARIGDTVLADGRALFVGDAAAATDPMTGEGIGQALATGIWAAQSTLAAGRDHPEVASARYEAAVARGLAVDHRVASALSRVLGSPTAARLAIDTTALTPWTRRNFARWMFEDYPRAVLATPRRWQRGVLTGAGAYRDR